MSNWDRYNRVIVAINDIDIATLGEHNVERLRLAENTKAELRKLANLYLPVL